VKLLYFFFLGPVTAITFSLGRGVRWISGKRFKKEIETPFEVELDDTYGTKMADLFDSQMFLCSNRLIEGFKKAGIKNLDLYDINLIDKKRKKKFENYKAVQIIGKIAAADMKKSKSHDPMNIGHTIVQFHNLVIDEKKIGKALMFRLAEDCSTILIHEKVKKELEKIPLEWVTIAKPEENVMAVTGPKKKK